MPSTLNRSVVSSADRQRQDVLLGEDSGLLVTVKADWPVAVSVWTPGDSAVGRGARRPLLLHLLYESPHLHVPAQQDMHWSMTIKFEKVLGP